MSGDVNISFPSPEEARNALHRSVPDNSWVLFTPHGGMLISTNAEDIKRSIDTIIRSSGQEEI